MLPFLVKPRQPGISVSVRPSDFKEKEDESPDAGLHEAAKDLMSAIKSDDFRRVAEALRAAFDLLDSEPHVEGEHLNESEQE